MSIMLSNITDANDLFVAILFDGMSDQMTNEITIELGELVNVSYDTDTSSIFLFWDIQMTDYVSRCVFSANISNIFGDDYGEFEITEPILFEVLEIIQSDGLDFEIKNTGSSTVNVAAMFSEYTRRTLMHYPALILRDEYDGAFVNFRLFTNFGNGNYGNWNTCSRSEK